MLRRMTTNPPPPLTGAVVIATRDRPDDLLRCLRALHAQTRAPLEIVVVDDGSEPPVDAPALRGNVPVRVLRTDGVGPASARNVGMRATLADVVIFTDDDTIAAPRWVQAALLRLREHPEEVAVEGPVRSPPYDPLHAYSVTSETAGHHWTCNIAYRREILERVGGFAEAVFAYAHCEDRDLASRALDFGPIGFEAEMSIVHTPRDMKIMDFIRRGRWVASELELARRHPDLIPRSRLPVTLPWPLDLSFGHARQWRRRWNAERGVLVRDPRRLLRFVAIAVGHTTVTLATALAVAARARGRDRR